MFDISDQAEFIEETLEVPITVGPGKQETYIKNLENTKFCLKKVSWSYSVDPANCGDYGWPKHPMQITIANVFSEKTSSPQTMSPPIILNSIDIAVANPSAISVTTMLKLKGTLVNSLPEHTMPSNKELLAYVSLTSSQRGMLSINNQMFKQMTEHMSALHPARQSPMLESNTPKALTGGTEDPDKLATLMLGDLVKLQTEQPLDVKSMQKIADFLISKGWKR